MDGILSLLVVGGGLIVALALLVYRISVLQFREGRRFGLREGLLGAAEWSFTDSWATTFTGVSALMGMFLALGIDVEIAGLGATTQFMLLNFFFAALILFAALVYQTTGRWEMVEQEGETERRYRSTVGWFLASSGLTLWAVAGQMFLLIFALWSIKARGLLNDAVGWIFIVMLLAALILLLHHGSRTVGELIKSQIDNTSVNTLMSRKNPLPVPERWPML